MLLEIFQIINIIFKNVFDLNKNYHDSSEALKINVRANPHCARLPINHIFLKM